MKRKMLNNLSYAALIASIAWMATSITLRTNLIHCVVWCMIITFAMASRLILWKTEDDEAERITSEEMTKMEERLFEDIQMSDSEAKQKLEWNAFMAVQRVRIYMQENGR